MPDDLLGKVEQAVSFSFLVQLHRLWCVLVWEFLLIPVGAKQDTPLGTITVTFGPTYL